MKKQTDRPTATPSAHEPTHQTWREWAAGLGLMLLSAAAMTLAQPPVDLWPLAYVALVPFLLGVERIRSARGVVLAGWVTGVLFWAVNLHWLSWVTPWGVGYIGAVLYLSVYWPLTGVLLRACLRAGWPSWASLPVFWVALEFARAHVISGFPWFFLAHTQWQQLVLIQIVDATGVYGVSFFVAMVNGLACDGLGRYRHHRGRSVRAVGARGLVIGSALTGVALVGLVGYGLHRHSETSDVTRPGPVIAVVQRAFPISLWHDTSRVEMLKEHFVATRDRIGPAIREDIGCDVVVWPETILPGGLNHEYLMLDASRLPAADIAALGGKSVDELAPPQIERARASIASKQGELRKLAGRINDLVRRVGSPIIAGGSTLHYRPSYSRPIDRWRIRNSVVKFDGNGLPGRKVYSKMHLVPFSEYVPFRESWPALHRGLRWFVPAVMSQLDYGREVELFELRGQGKRAGEVWRAATPICYEGTFGRVCREMVMGPDGAKRADILLNLSNDGWFALKLGRRWTGSAEHPQHLVHYVFRAIETRCPVVRAVNTGVSASISSQGRLEAVVSQGDRWAMVKGALLLDGGEGPVAGGGAVLRGPRVLVDGRTTLYSVAGDWFAIVVSILAAVAAIALIARGKRGFRRRNEST